jgi:hypothetical protein
MAARFKFDATAIRISEADILADLVYPARRPDDRRRDAPSRAVRRPRRRR